MSIATRILEARLAKGFTQEALARKIGVSKGAIGNYENGVSVPKIEIMFKLFDILGHDANYFYQDDCPAIIPQTPADLSKDESLLLDGYRSLSKEGKAYMLQTLAMAQLSYPKNCVSVSDLADHT